MTRPARYPAAAPTSRTRIPFIGSAPHHVGGRPEPLQQHHEGEAVPPSRPAPPVVVGPPRDPDRLPAVLPETVQLVQEVGHRLVRGLLPPLLDVLSDRVLPQGAWPRPSEPARSTRDA